MPHRSPLNGRFGFVASFTGCAAECAVRFEPVCSNTGFFATSTKCFRAG